MPAPSQLDGSARSAPALLAMLVSIGLAVLKGAVWILTGSVAMLASALDSATDAMICLANLLVIRHAARPADREHPFGHGALEDLAALLQSLVIAGSGVVVIAAAWQRFVEEAVLLDHPALGVGAAIVSLLVALGLSIHLRRAGRRLDSPALSAVGDNFASDTLTNVAVLAAFIGSWAFGATMLDPIISVGIAFIILRTAWDLFSSAAHSIMDRELAAADLELIDTTVRSFAPRVHGYHDLLTRRSGPDRFIQFHMEVDAHLTFREAHDLTEEVTAALRAAVPRAFVTIHPDPWPEDPDTAEPRLEHAPDSRFSPSD